ncbi:NADH-quinone oxidoreductase subunit M [Ketogulonicigenium robustum]|uniref:NADH-quinone oxidoreductase subunit M n=1 Tax=Ketogulonicigenium robustum TaxID=92947 RepID=A0A1W6P1P2_9RHOB|nr:NADH-quinone oxidoreductase subunit M [Ketogulonicigenium robustum]ARO15217.1 NADH-quinone oxidoreductase subunit M [Ketogulonicigenium robustum]
MLLSLVTFLPAIGALVLALFLRGEGPAAQRNARWVALGTTVATFVASLFILFGFDPAYDGFQFVEDRAWVMGLSYRMGVDGISVLFIMLTTFLMPLVILTSWEVSERARTLMIAWLLLETLMIGVFAALDLVLFYLFFEAGLIPMFLIIGVWGGQNRVYAAFKFFLYTFLGSVLMLVAMLVMYWDAGTTCIAACGEGGVELLNYSFPMAGGMQVLLFLAFMASFAVKLPMWPVHTWLPDAHVQAPTAGSVVLAAVLLKMGGYGFLRFSLPMFPLASEMLAPLMLWLSAIAVVYASLVALVQTDMKKLIAYSSVAHMGFVTMGLFALNRQGIDGAIFQMISHGFISAALFLCVGVIYDRMHTREIAAFGGLLNRMPVYGALFLLFTMANIGLPGTSGFVGEFLALMGAYQANSWVALVAGTGIILSAGYGLWLFRRVIMGAITHKPLQAIADLTPREIAIFVPLVVMTLLLGVYPSLVTDITGPSVQRLVDHVAAEIAAAGGY